MGGDLKFYSFSFPSANLCFGGLITGRYAD